ncbi:hypothetical protein UY3_11226 [Chelonia mydas]|uniref:Uncharacterized protein n=1 Tax=Chelonia mydas TaxID=8469 RepID=M7B3I4_CHEMY|nr:hypothetical protein UY3_11226 [Chelonia mydas]
MGALSGKQIHTYGPLDVQSLCNVSFQSSSRVSLYSQKEKEDLRHLRDEQIYLSISFRELQLTSSDALFVSKEADTHYASFRDEYPEWALEEWGPQQTDNMFSVPIRVMV